MDIQFGLPGGVGAGQENERWDRVDPVFPGGLSFGGNGRAIRDAGASSRRFTRLATGAVIEVSWQADVAWQKEIRLSDRKWL
jgi:hypothetical protein